MPLEKLKIKSSELGGYEVKAYFNPKELGISKTVPWQQQKDAKGESPPVEFTTGAPKTMDFELLCDRYEEENKDVYSQFVQRLEKFVLIDEKLKRPPLIECAWSNNFPVFKGVIESMTVKYTMFLENGTPCRCTVNLKLKQADSASVAAAGGSTGANAQSSAGVTTTQEQASRPDQATAAATGGNPSSGEVRETMNNSDVDNPRDIPPGTTVTPPGGG